MESKDTPYIAHQDKDKSIEQPLIEHLLNTADRAEMYAGAWGGAFARLCGLAHDLGKYSKRFQKRIRGKNVRVDHATAGGQLLYEISKPSKIGILAAYCVMGHHGGLPNGGSLTLDTADNATLYGRLKRQVERYDAYQSELTLPSFAPFQTHWEDGFDCAFFVRMVYSALVDADWLDTEAFYNGHTPRGGFASIAELYEKLSVHTETYLNAAGEISNLYKKRNDLLRDCLSAAELPSGLFSLTAPTGSGKTIASLAFALLHAMRHGKRRVIYFVPYNTIIEQNAAVFEKLLGKENVLCHYSDVDYNDDALDDDLNEISLNKRHSIENWDYPLIITSNVQFFESLFSNKSSKCRKLHNIADSVLLFDEAQMIPVPYLLPCIRAIKTLVTQYGCTAVLATATQPSLDKFFSPLPVVEITKKPVELYSALRRTTLRRIETPLTDSELASRLAAEKQVLCVVNSRRGAQDLYAELMKKESEGTFHLSTTMYPVHRKRVLKEIRKRLNSNAVCRVISTSLVEAGVDLDFETVYREMAGLDSIIQAGGRCNRESERPYTASIVYVFTSADHKPPRMIQHNIDACSQVARRYEDLTGLDAIRAYFDQLHYDIGRDRLDEKNIVTMFNDGARSVSFPFADVAKAFRLIDDQQQRTLYILHEAPDLEKRLRADERSRELFRELGAYSCSLYEQDVRKLEAIGAIDRPDRLDETIMLLTRQYYDDQTGVSLSPEGGHGLFPA